MYDPNVTIPSFVSKPTESLAAKQIAQLLIAKDTSASGVGSSHGQCLLKDHNTHSVTKDKTTSEGPQLESSDEAVKNQTETTLQEAVTNEKDHENDPTVPEDNGGPCARCLSCAKPLAGETDLEYEIRCLKHEFEHTLQEMCNGMAATKLMMSQAAEDLERAVMKQMEALDD